MLCSVISLCDVVTFVSLLYGWSLVPFTVCSSENRSFLPGFPLAPVNRKCVGSYDCCFSTLYFLPVSLWGSEDLVGLVSEFFLLKIFFMFTLAVQPPILLS